MKTQKTEQIVSVIISRGHITEREISLLKSRLNRGSADYSEVDPLFEDYGISITDSQTSKGLSWLLNQYKGKSGKIRKNNPFGYREIDALETFESFDFIGFYDLGYFRPFYVPIYRVNGETACFDYYVSGGEPVIIG